MCLDTIYRGKRKKEALAKLPESGYYWKVVRKLGRLYYPPIWDDMSYKTGWNFTGINCRTQEDYAVAFHIFRDRKDAYAWWQRLDIKVVRVIVKKKDIINIGKDSDGLCIVTTRFWCPKPKR